MLIYYVLKMLLLVTTYGVIVVEFHNFADNTGVSSNGLISIVMVVFCLYYLSDLISGEMYRQTYEKYNQVTVRGTEVRLIFTRLYVLYLYTAIVVMFATAQPVGSIWHYILAALTFTSIAIAITEYRHYSLKPVNDD